MDINLLESILKKSWSKKTCHPAIRKDWTLENPAIGQCAITALIVHDYFGGELLYCKHHHHYWNRLPDNNEIDLTRCQFPKDIKICIDEVKQRGFNLKNKYDKEAKTLKRYKILKRQVENILKQKEENSWLYLMSSNASKEYILDILETLSLPFGTVQHFRYLVRWLDDDLKKKIPEKNGKNELKNIKVGIYFLYQEKKGDKWQWRSIYPIRTGILMDAYKTGDRDNDVAHFYFKVENYISYDNSNCSTVIKKLLKEKNAYNNGNHIEGEGISGKTLVFLYEGLPKNCIGSVKRSNSAFNNICESINLDHFKSPEGDIQYYPFFHFIEGLKGRKEELVKPKYDSLLKKSTYNLLEGERYSFKFNTYFPKEPPEYAIKLTTDERVFSTPKEYKLNIASRYDEESWPLIPSLLEKDVWTVVSFETESKNINGKEPLNIHINFFIHIERNIFYRIIDVFSDIGFGVGTGSIALAKIIEGWTWWYYPVIIGYAVWGISKIIIKFWRG